MAIKGIQGGQLKILSEEQVRQIHLATLEVLNDVGVKFPYEPALKMMADYGCRVDFNKQIVKIPEYVLKKFLNFAPSRFTLYGKEPEFDIILDCTNTVYTLGGAGASFVLDLEGKRRPATLNDLINFTRLQDELNHPNIIHLQVWPQDIPTKRADRVIFATMLKNSRKCLHAPSGGAEGVKAHVQMAAVIQGDIDKVGEKPIFLENVCPQSPLFLPEESIKELMEASKYKIPVVIEPDAQAGGTAPITLAGAIVEQNVDVLSALILSQMVSPGTPCIYGCGSAIMDMRIGSISGGAPETTLIHVASCQMAHFYNLPFQGGFPTDALIPDSQAGYENALHILSLVLGGCNIIHAVSGSLETSRLSNYEQCVIDNEIFEAAFRIADGIKVNQCTLGVKALKEVGPGGNFLTHPHTLEYLRTERWAPKITFRESWEVWGKKSGKDMRERAKEVVRRLLKARCEESISEDASREIDTIAGQSSKRH